MSHNPRPLKRYDQDGVTVTIVREPDVNGYARDCSCGWRGVMWATEIAADGEWIRHVAEEAAKRVGVTLSMTTEVGAASGTTGEDR